LTLAETTLPTFTVSITVKGGTMGIRTPLGISLLCVAAALADGAYFTL
jgi:hypothetical protein